MTNPPRELSHTARAARGFMLYMHGLSDAELFEGVVASDIEWEIDHDQRTLAEFAHDRDASDTEMAALCEFESVDEYREWRLDLG
jgi:hypothetical protein